MNPDSDRFQLSGAGRRWLVGLTVVGAVTLLVGLVASPARAWANLLLVGYYLVGLGLGATFFIAMQYLCVATWAVPLRRVPEAMCAVLPAGAAVLLIVFLAGHSIYPWTHPSPEPAEGLRGFKGLWLNLPFLVGRAAVFLGIWILLARLMVRNSQRQDVDAGPSHTAANVRLSALFAAVFAATFWVASFDWIMSLEPQWYSTIFGIYNFAGLFVSSLAAVVLLTVWMRRFQPLGSFVSPDHLHDLGKLLLAFSTFWAYIWFSQYMLIWYANIPEETGHFIRRLRGAWGPLFVLNLFLNWVVPFFWLLRSRAKRSPATLAKVSVVLLLGHWLDLYLMIFPVVVGKQPVLGPCELGLVAGGVGLFLLIFIRSYGSAVPVPLRDPWLPKGSRSSH